MGRRHLTHKRAVTKGTGPMQTSVAFVRYLVSSECTATTIREFLRLIRTCFPSPHHPSAYDLRALQLADDLETRCDVCAADAQRLVDP